MDDILPEGNIGCLVELLAGLVEEGRAPTREQIRAHLESLCRAQVAKVCNWLIDNDKKYLVEMSRDTLEALRAAAGMEGGK